MQHSHSRSGVRSQQKRGEPVRCLFCAVWACLWTVQRLHEETIEQDLPRQDATTATCSLVEPSYTKGDSTQNE